MASDTGTGACGRDGLVDRAEALRDRLRADQADDEQRTHYSAEMHEEFERAGFYRMYVPARYGGLEVDVPTFTRVMLALGRGSMEAAWCLCLSANHALQVGTWFGERAQDEIFGDGGFRAASVAAPTVVATQVDGGWRLEGTVGYCSGIPYSTHYVGMATIAGTERAAEPRTAIFVAPREAFEVLGDWGGLLGLKGTGSDSIRFDGAVVPEHHLLTDANMIDYAVPDGNPGVALHGNPMYGGRALFVYTASLAGPVIGGAYGALDEYAEWMRTRSTPLPPMVPRIGDADFQRWYGNALARIATAEAALLHCADEHMRLCRQAAREGRTYSVADDHRLAAVVREACVQVWEAVEQQLLRTIGSSALRAGERFERSLRNFAQFAGHRNLMLRDHMHRVIAAQDLGAEVAR